MVLLGLRFPGVGGISSSARHLQKRFYNQQRIRGNEHWIQLSDEVKHAVAQQGPVVALETTIYTHGFPYPDNVDLAFDLESIVRKNGGIPATIGVIDGIARVGLTADQIRTLASSAGKPETMKVSRRDLPYILGMGLAGRNINGGTTVSGTMFLAKKAGIKVFGTGGLGGVHRGGQDTMDISADLTELGRTPVAVISSGCKSFLDIPRTLEYLETQGVGVYTLADGRTGDIDFPAFYTRESGVKGPMVVQNAKEAAAIIRSQYAFTHSSGLLFGNPIPEEFSIPKAEIDIAINQAVQEAAERGFHGHANTPFILARIKELTEGRSIPANRALIESNVTMATKIAVELSQIIQDSRLHKFESSGTSTTIPLSSSPQLSNTKIDAMKRHTVSDASKPSLNPEHTTVATQKTTTKIEVSDDVNVLVFGSVAIDFSCDYTPQSENSSHERPASGKETPSSADPGMVDQHADSSPRESKHNPALSPTLHTSNIASIATSLGGVGHNVALAIHRIAGSQTTVRLCSLIADDLAGTTVISSLESEGLNTNNIIKVPAIPENSNRARTAQYVAINDTKKDLVFAMADMDIFNAAVSDPFDSTLPDYPNLKWVVVDANWNPDTARKIMKRFAMRGANVAFEPVSVAKSAAIFKPSKTTHLKPLQVFPNHSITLTSPNHHELAAMHASAKKHEHFESERWWRIIDAMGIPSSGARDRFVSITNQKMTDEGIPIQAVQLLPIIPTILTKLGANGVLLTELLKPNDPRLTDPDDAPYILSRCTNGSTEVGGVYMRLFPAVEQVHDVVSVNGVGDTFLGVLIGGLAKGLKLGEDLIDIAQRGAVMTLKSPDSVSPKIEDLRPILALMGSRR